MALHNDIGWRVTLLSHAGRSVGLPHGGVLGVEMVPVIYQMTLVFCASGPRRTTGMHTIPTYRTRRIAEKRVVRKDL
jgi:hypothetical protein